MASHTVAVCALSTRKVVSVMHGLTRGHHAQLRIAADVQATLSTGEQVLMAGRTATSSFLTLKRSAGFAALLLGALWVHPALANELDPIKGAVWTKWGTSPLIIGGCLLGSLVYLRGFVLRWTRRRRVSLWRAASYISAIALIYIWLQSPFDALSDHVFWIHRVQHAALHVWIPVLLVLSAPVTELTAGLPRWARRYGVRPVLRNRLLRRSWRFIQHPIVAPILFVGLIYVWLTPVLCEYATVNDTVYDIMYFSLFAEGIAFWWLMLDPKPGRVSYGQRIIILWLIMPPQMLIGFYVMFTSRVLYPLYATLDKGWVTSYLIDQNVGGMVVWIPSIMMSALAAVIVLRFWMHQERREAAPASVAGGRRQGEPQLMAE